MKPMFDFPVQQFQTRRHYVQRIEWKMLLLLGCWIIVGITAKDPPKTHHYRLINSSLCLQVGISPPYKDDRWKVNDTFFVIYKNVTPNYTNKVDYNPGNFSLCIKKLTEKDSGTYTVSVVGFDLKESTETHILTVQEAVPTPVIKTFFMSANLSAGFCNITVNCSIQDDWVWSVCDGDSCRTHQRTFRKVNITIFTKNRSIVCTGNNHVSTSNVSKSMEGKCFKKFNPQHEETPKLLVLIVIVTVIIIVVCVFLCACIVSVAMRCFSTRCNHQQAQTSPAQLIHSQPVEAQLQPVPRVSTSSSSEAEASYENVEATQPGQASGPGEELGSRQSQKVDSVYCFLQTPNVTASVTDSDSSKDTKGHMMIQKASASQPVAQDEAEKAAPIDTVYSVLQKPKNMKSQHHQ